MAEGGGGGGECPVCGELIPTSEELLRHANAHFEHGSPDGDVVDLTVSPEAAVARVQSSGAASGPGRNGRGVAERCLLCGQSVPQDERDSHALMHELSEEKDGPNDEERKVRELQEAEDFHQLRKRYGLEEGSPKKRKGRCFTCQEEGHWSSDCSKKRSTAAATPPPPLSLLPAELRGAQSPEPSPSGRHGDQLDLVRMVKRLLEGQKAHSCRAALSGDVTFYGGQKQDRGWGCGWRNLQILASHLIGKACVGPHLFGGAGFVPDIRSLQAWMEVAWADGFDPEGSEHFGGRVQGTPKWIGATDAAALLRYFGARALLVDFCRAPRPTGEATCAKCQARLAGVRLRSVTDREVQLCAACAPHPPRDDFLPVEPIRAPAGAPQHTVLAEWVWRYFTAEPAVPGCARAGGGAGGAAGAGSGGKARAQPAGGLSRLGGTPVLLSGRPPLFFQHDGHSRTIMGIERRRLRPSSPEEWYLLVLDPAMTAKELGGALGAGTGWQKLLKRGVHTLRMNDYQLMMVAPGVAAEEERAALRGVQAFEVHGGA